MTDERRVVTVLFADVVDSTGLGESLDPEEVRALLSRYFEVAREVLTSHGGTLEKFIGDAVVGVFGIPQAHGDDPKRAIDAALELRDRLRTDSQLSGLKVRFGLGTGEVVTTRGQGADFFVGDAVNVAARLQQAGGEWMILATERTVRSAATAFEVGPLRQIEVKGRTAPVAAYEVRSRRQRQQQRPGSRLPFRGRADEFEELQVFCRRAFRERRPAVISIIAPAGTGKTRLLEEFLDRESGSWAPTPRVATAQCLPYGQQLTYWPLRQMLFQLVGVAEEASSSQVRAALEAWVDEPRTADLLARSIGASEGETPDRMDVFTAWRSAVERASRDQPLILVFEDLHWSSDSLLDLVEFVMQPRGEAAVLMLALARPELIDRRSSWGGGRRNFLNLFLEPLGDGEIRSLVIDLLSDQSAERVEQIVARAEGNPFYAEELVRSVLEHAHAAELPDTVQATVLARLDLLPETEQRVLKLGSIYGRSFRAAGVEALAADVTAVQAAVDSLLIGDLIRSTTEDSLEFRHILIREVAYQTMTRAERARLHATAATWLESQAFGREDAIAEIVAFHYREALAMLGRQQLPNFDLAAVRVRAVSWLRRAADTTAAAGATLEAARHLQAAIGIASEDDLPELYERLGDVEQLRQGSVAAYRKALDCCRAARRPADQQLRVIGGLLMCVQRWWEGVGRMSREEIEQLREDGHALAATATDDRALARFLAADAFYPWHMHRQGTPVPADALARAEASARRAVDISERTGDLNTWSAALDGVASCAIERCDWSAAREAARQRVAQQARLVPVERLDAYHMVFDTSMALADLHEADRVLAQATSVDWAPHSAEFVGLLSDQMCVLALLGRWDELSAIAERAVKHWSEHHGASGPASFGFVAGYELALARRSTLLADRLREALLQLAAEVASGPFLRAIAERDWEAIERGMLTRLDLGQGSDLRVERVLSTVVDRRQPIRSETITSILDHAVSRGLPLLEAQARRAAGQFERAIEIWEGSGAVPYAARARIELARSRGHEPDAGDVSTLRTLQDLEYLEISQLAVEAG
jgi:class 3 adenylate cyclase/tetratricopeptide (TPR) repeat protein